MHARVSVNACCFPGESLETIFDHWRELAPARVSLVSDVVLGASFAATQKLFAASNYQIETIIHPFLLRATLENKDALAAAQTKLSKAIDAAARLGARSVYFFTGGRGALTWEQAAETISAAIKPCIAQAKDSGVLLLTETAGPLYADIHIAHSLRDTVTLAEMAGIGVNIDLFTCWAEAGLEQTIRRAMPRCGLVQVSDYVLGDRASPCRAVPGDGAIPLARLFDWILDAGYQGAFDLELIGPRIDQAGRVAACRRAADWVTRYLETR